MAKKPISQKSASRKQQDNLTLQKVFNVFLLGLVAECYLFIVYRGFVSGSVDAMLVWYRILGVSAWVGLAALVIGAALAFIKRSDAKLRKYGLWAVEIGLFLAISGWTMTNIYPQGVTAMCVLVPVATLLAMIAYLFQRECFVTTLVLAATFFAVWACGAGLGSVTWSTHVVIGAVLAALLLAGALGFIALAHKSGGKLFGKQVFPAECGYPVLYAVTALCLVCVIASLLAVSFTYYLLWALGILLFVELVYYTTKLM